MTQSFIPPFRGGSPVLGRWSLDRVDTEQAQTPLSCLDGCTVDHIADAQQGNTRKMCKAVTPVRVAARPSHTPTTAKPGAMLVVGVARTEGAYRTAEIGICREGQPNSEALFFDPAEALALAAALIAAVDETEALARTAVAVEL